MYIVRSNIFKPGSDFQREFERYRIQVSIIHRPEDHEFNLVLHTLDLHLHNLTGRYVVFFPLLDPSDEWLEAVRGTMFEDWWRFQGQFLSPFNDSLTQQLAGFFGLDWQELPALVISPSLWEGQAIAVPTSANIIEAQFALLTEIAENFEKPEINMIAEKLAQSLGIPYKLLGYEVRALAAFYEILETLSREGDRYSERYWPLLKEVLDYIRAELMMTRRAEDDAKDQDETASVHIDAAVRLLAAAARVAQGVYQPVLGNVQTQIADYLFLENNSKTLIETASLVSWFLDFLDNRRVNAYHVNDFTPAAQGYWKALEYEINYSIIQAARAARNIQMPKYFTLYDPNFPQKASLVQTGNRQHNINAVDHQSLSGQHKFLTLGNAWHVINAMNNNQAENLDQIILQCLQNPLPQHYLAVWQRIYEMRNPASHTDPLSKGDYNQLISDFINAQMFEPLVNIKSALC
jgi:hypothetical protein